MAVCRQDIENALAIAIDDEAMGDDNIKLHEVDSIKKRFNQLLDKLREEANEESEDL